MRRIALLLLTVLAGCTISPTNEKKPVTPFSLSFERAEPVELLNGEEREFVVLLNRAEGFTDPVTLRAEVSPADAGVTARVDKKSRKAVVNVSETAQSGDYVVRLVGQARDDAGASAELRVRVPPKD